MLRIWSAYSRNAVLKGPFLSAALLAALSTVGMPVPSALGQGIGGTIFDERAYVEREASNRIGVDFACAVVTDPETDPSHKLLILVTSNAAATTAQQLGSELTRAARVEVRVVPQRYRKARIDAIHRRAMRTFPSGAQGLGIGERGVYMDHCPRVDLVLLPKGEATTKSKRWARRLIERYGRDRVYVSRGRAWPRNDDAPGSANRGDRI